MTTKLIAALVLLVALIAAGWRIHHNIYQSGYDAAEKKATAVISQLENTATASKDVIARLESDKKVCEEGRLADAKAAKAAVDAADKARVALIAKAGKADKTLREMMSGECKIWAQQPACGALQ